MATVSVDRRVTTPWGAMAIGLAGSLGLADVAPLAELGPDYLGFRGALCGRGGRTAGLDAAAIAEVRAAVRRCMPVAALPAAPRRDLC